MLRLRTTASPLSLPSSRLLFLSASCFLVSSSLATSSTSKWLNDLSDLRFTTISPLYEPTDDGSASQCFISKSFDATSHAETIVQDVNDMWQRIKGEPLVLKKRETEIEA